MEKARNQQNKKEEQNQQRLYQEKRKQNKIKQKEKKRVAGSFAVTYCLELLTTIYMLLMLVIYPLAYHDRYFDIGDFKYQFFKIVSTIFLLMLILGYIIKINMRKIEMIPGYLTCIFLAYPTYSLGLSRKYDETGASMYMQLSGALLFALVAIALIYIVVKRKEQLPELRKNSLLDAFVALYGCLAVFSYCFSSFKEIGYWGYPGWYMGIFSQTIFVLIYYFISRYWRIADNFLVPAAGAAALIYLMGILQRFSIDPLGMYEGLSAEYIEKFIATIGQTSWYSSYAVLILPVGFWYFWRSDALRTRILAGVFSVLGFGMICTTNSDSAYIAVLLILFIFFWYSLEDGKSFARFWQLTLVGLGTFVGIGLLQLAFPEQMITHVLESEALSFFITQSTFVRVCCILNVLLCLGLQFVPKKKWLSAKQLRILRGSILGILGLAVVTCLVCIILVTNGRVSPENPINQVAYFHFNVAWGNHRGFNWRMAMQAITHASPKDMLIGVGPDCFAEAMNRYCREQVFSYWNGIQLACAHNEFLNLLVTQGILGLAAYLGIFVYSLVRFGRGVKQEPRIIIYMASIVAYLGHNFFCYQQCVATPIIFILIGMGERYIRANKENL